MLIWRKIFNMKNIFLLFLLFSSTTNYAQEPAWWTKQKKDCNLPPSLAYNTWVAQGSPCNKTVHTGPSAEELEQIRFVNARNTYNGVLDWLRDYSIETVVDNTFTRTDRLYSEPQPQNLFELESLANRLFIQATYKRRWYYWKFFKNSDLETNLRKSLKLFKSENQRLQNELAAAPGLLQKATEKKDNIVASLERQEKIVASLDTEKKEILDHLKKSMGDSYDIIYYLLPPAQRATFKKSYQQKKPWHVDKLQELWIWSPSVKIKPEKPSSFKPVTPHKPAPGNWDRSVPAIPAGGVENTLKAIENMRAVFSEYGTEVINQEKEIPQLQSEINSLAYENYSLSNKLEEYKSPLEKIAEMEEEAQSKMTNAILNKGFSAKNVSIAAASVVAWDWIKDKVVVPAAEKFLEDNGIKEHVELLQLADKIKKNPLELFSSYDHIKNVNVLIEAEKKVLGLFDHFQEYALKATDALAHGDVAEVQRLANDLFDDLDKNSLELVKTASQSMEGSIGKIITILVNKRSEE